MKGRVETLPGTTRRRAELALDCANATLAECGEAMGETTLYSFKVSDA
jgi:hypothetical protein